MELFWAADAWRFGGWIGRLLLTALPIATGWFLRALSMSYSVKLEDRTLVRHKGSQPTRLDWRAITELRIESFRQHDSTSPRFETDKVWGFPVIIYRLPTGDAAIELDEIAAPLTSYGWRWLVRELDVLSARAPSAAVIPSDRDALLARWNDGGTPSSDASPRG